MRIAYVGVSHYHTILYLEPALGMTGVTVVGVSDRDTKIAQGYAQRLSCQWSSDYRDLCKRLKPDFVFVLGRHCDMAETGRFLVDAGIPFAMEKPCGINTREVEELAERAAAAGAFAAVPLVYRQSSLLKTIHQRADGEDIQYLSFKFIFGPPSRYREVGSDFMIDLQQGGGGCTLNLSVHFIDLFRVLMGNKPIQVKAAVMSNAAWNLDIEDYSAVILQSGPRTCLIETGYIYPAPNRICDMRFCIRTDRHYFIAMGRDTLEVSDENNQREILNIPTTNLPVYPEFVSDVLARAKQGQAPIADMGDMTEVMRLVDAAYAMAGRRGPQ